MVSRLTDLRYVEARNYTRTVGSNGTVTRIVIHDMEMPEAGTTAETCAQMFHTTTRQASAHFCVDNDSAIQCVPLDCRAWHAPPNTGSVGIEHAGYARQTRAQWLDSYGLKMLDISAELTARLCKMFGIPIVKLSVTDLKNGKRGICGHVDVSNAWHKTSHTDPGSNFPWDVYLDMVRKHSAPAPTTAKGTDDVTDDDLNSIASKVWNRFTVTAPDGTEIHLVDALERLLKNTETPKD